MSLRSLVPFGRRGELARGEADPFLTLHREIDRVFDDMWRGFGRTPATANDAAWTPRVDVRETPTAIEVTAELPGVDEKDIDVNLANDVLTIKGEKKSEKEEKDGGYYAMERSYGAFQRSLALPFAADPDRVSASFDKGVLKVAVAKPKEAAAMAKKIEIKKAS